MLFIVYARDGTDPDALDRRMTVRPDHFANVRAMKERGEFRLGGALLSANGRMIGSMVLVDFPDRAALDGWLADEPYVKGGVWNDIEVHPFLQADI